MSAPQGKRRAPSPKRRARELVCDLGCGSFSVGHVNLYSGEWANANVTWLRRILAREFSKAADARVRRELRKVAEEIRSLLAYLPSTSPEHSGAGAALDIVEACAAPKPKPDASSAMLEAESAYRRGIQEAMGSLCPCESDADEPGPHLPTCRWMDPNYDGSAPKPKRARRAG